MGWSWRVRALASSPSLSERSSRLASANEHDAVEPKPRGLVAVQVDVPRGGAEVSIADDRCCCDMPPAGGRTHFQRLDASLRRFDAGFQKHPNSDPAMRVPRAQRPWHTR